MAVSAERSRVMARRVSRSRGSGLSEQLLADMFPFVYVRITVGFPVKFLCRISGRRRELLRASYIRASVFCHSVLRSDVSGQRWGAGVLECTLLLQGKAASEVRCFRVETRNKVIIQGNVSLCKVRCAYNNTRWLGKRLSAGRASARASLWPVMAAKVPQMD